MLRNTRRVGACVVPPAGKASVTEQNLLRATVTVQLEKNPDAAPQVFSVKEVRVLRSDSQKTKKADPAPGEF